MEVNFELGSGCENGGSGSGRTDFEPAVIRHCVSGEQFRKEYQTIGVRLDKNRSRILRKLANLNLYVFWAICANAIGCG
jgi:hypothetical protein